VIITKDTTTLVGGAAAKKELDVRITQLDHQIEQATNDYDREQLEQRKAKLQGGVAVIRVGGATEMEMKQNKRLMQDSLSATRAAIEEGIVIGGGVALLRAARVVDSLSLTEGEAVGAQVVAKACSAPLRQLVENSGGDGSVVVKRVREGTEGFNAQTGAIEDLHKAGILDPGKVVSAALIHAVSSAGIILLSEVLVGDAEED